MNLLRSAIGRQMRAVRSSPWLAALVLLTAVTVACFGAYHDKAVKSIIYLAAMWICAIVVDFVTLWRPDGVAPVVRKPEREARLVLVCFGIGLAALCIRFVFFDWRTLPVVVRLLTAAGFSCVFPIAIASILLLWKYKPRELGFRWSPSAWVFILAVGLTAGAAFLAAPHEVVFGEFIRSEGVIGLIVTAFLAAGLSEEFTRIVAQTRLVALTKHVGGAWFIASCMWALMHVPKWYSDDGNAFEALMGSVRILPLGLMWGYMTHRARSIFPAWMAHGMNLWGLQNF